MPVYIRDIVTDALADIGVLGAGEVADAGQGSAALRKLNSRLDLWKARNLFIPHLTRATATLTASQASFTVGAGGQINIPRPGLGQLERVTYIDTGTNPALELSLGPLLLEAEYQAIPDKAETGSLPSQVYYNPTYPLGTLYPFPIPTGAGLQWVLYYWAPVAEFADINVVVDLPAGYRQLLITALAVDLLPSYSRQPNPALVAQAAEAMRTVTLSNQRLVMLHNDADGITHGWGAVDIYSGS